MRLVWTLILPMVGNSILMISGDWLLTRVGYYLYFLGLDVAVMQLLHFTFEYCQLRGLKPVGYTCSAFILFDVVQMLLNEVHHHAFDTHPTMVDGFTYWSLDPFLGQSIHRFICYGVFFVSIALFIYQTIKVPRIYKERYLVILFAMLLVGGWETFYIFSGIPVDQSMIGFGVFGLLVYYFSLRYKPFRLLDRMLAQVVYTIDEAIFFFDRNGTCIYTNAAGERIFGIKDEDGLASCARWIRDVVGEDSFDMKHDWSCQRSTGEGALCRYWDIDFRTMKDERGEQVGSFITARDRTQEEMDLRQTRYDATHDHLTGLYNMEYLYEQARRAMEARPDLSWYVLAFDVKEFKLVNDIFSKEFGDKVLCDIADFIHRNAAPGDIYGRLTGDRFGVVTPAVNFDIELAEQLLSDRSEYTEVNYPINIHMGVYEVTEPNLPVSVMFDRAFMAIASIKNDLQRHVALYDAKMRDDVIWNQRISAELDEAIATGQVRPYLQPMVDDAGKVKGAEVLVRWIHPEEGFLAPYRFIPCFEENGRIAQLDCYMWECACNILRMWQDRGIDLFLSVNISPKDFYFMNVFDVNSNLSSEYCIDPRKLRLEITETVVMNDLENRMQILDSLRRYGFLVEMDDFGSGYSSLNMLKDMPVDLVKIDMMFLYKSKNQDKAQTILRSVVDLTRNLGMLPLTEGVETPEQFSMLAVMGCALFQGYYFAKPMPVPEFEEFCQIAG